jgi:hypothetical protein
MVLSGPKKEVPAVAVRSVTCPGCGGAVTIRSFGSAVNVVCGSCHSVLDAQDPQVKILQKFKDAIRQNPLLPLGSRGKIRGILFEIIGFQHRQIEADGQVYGWGEYLLFNPYQGFRYLTEFSGHWNFIAPLRTLPQAHTPGAQSDRFYLGERYKHFQTATAKTTFVLGEFPWQVRVGETAEVTDYVSPPRVLSTEVSSDKEINWSMGEYITGTDIWQAFGLKDQPPPAVGVYENQPSPFGSQPRKIWRYCGLLLGLALLLWIFHLSTAHRQQVFSEAFVFDPAANEASFVTAPFEFEGASTVQVDTAASLHNQWIFINFALVNEETGKAYDFSREVSYYGGVDEGESWTEGSPRDSVTLPRIPAGKYFLRIEPDGDHTLGKIGYSVAVIHDVPNSTWFLIAAPLLLLPAIFTTWRSIGFEHRRWQESDHAPATSSSSSDGDDSE